MEEKWWLFFGSCDILFIKTNRGSLYLEKKNPSTTNKQPTFDSFFLHSNKNNCRINMKSTELFLTTYF